MLVHPTCGPTQEDDIAGEVRFQTFERLASEVANKRIRWTYLLYAMHMAGPREALEHMIICKNYRLHAPHHWPRHRGLQELAEG